MTLNLLEKSILATIAYYDVLDCPLTGFEVFKYLINPLHTITQSGFGQNLELEPINKVFYLDVLNNLKNLSHPLGSPLRRIEASEARYIDEHNGFYFLKNRKEIFKTKIERQKISDQKRRKTRKIICWLQIIPYLRLVAISGSVALSNAQKNSDIDLLIIAKHKRIWTARFILSLFIHLIGKRRHAKKTKDRLCLNHYITDQSLKINFPSLYNAQTYSHLIPVLEIEQDIYKKFQQANKWIKDYLFIYPKQEIPDQRQIKKSKFLRKIAKFQEFILDTFIGSILEKIFKIIQKISIKIHSLRDRGEGRVVTDEFQLEFHPQSPETEVIDKYNKKVIELGLAMRPEKNSGLM